MTFWESHCPLSLCTECLVPLHVFVSLRRQISMSCLASWLSGHLALRSSRPGESSPSDSRSPELSQDTLPVAYAAFSNLASYSHSLKHLDVSKMGMSYVGIFRTQVTMT